jgi:hypothetical protein
MTARLLDASACAGDKSACAADTSTHLVEANALVDITRALVARMSARVEDHDPCAIGARSDHRRKLASREPTFGLLAGDGVEET